MNSRTITQIMIYILVVFGPIMQGACKSTEVVGNQEGAPEKVDEEKRPIPARDDLIFYYSSDETEDGKPLDFVQSDVNELFSGESPSLMDGPFGKTLACYGDGDQDIYRYGLHLGTNDFTIAFWVNVSSYTISGLGQRGLVVYGYDPRLSVYLKDSDKMTLEMPDAGKASMSASGVPPQEKWTHLAFVVDRNNDDECAIYMNGQKQPMTSVSMASSSGHEYNMNTGFMFGRSLVGHLDEMAVYARALTAEEVATMVGEVPEAGSPFGKSVITEEDTLPPDREPFRLKAERQAAAQKKRRMLYNDDGVYVHPFDTPEKFINVRLRQIFGRQVDTVTFNVGATTLFTFDNDVGETYGEFINESSPAWAQNVKKSVAALRESGHSTAGLALEHCHKNGIEFFLSLRMNDIHDSFHAFMRSRYKRNHPQYLFGPKSLNYEIPAVRDYIFRITESFCTNYDIDGIELDWWRDPRAFPPSWVGEPLEPWHVEAMNNLIRRIRYMTERVGEERGRPILLAVRTPSSVERALFVGFDLKTWFEEDLVDILAIGGGYAPVAINSTVREMVDFAQPFGVPVYPVLSGSGMNSGSKFGAGVDYRTLGIWRGAAMNIWHSGGSGVYTFNFFPRHETLEPEDVALYPLLDQMGSPETLKGLGKIYSIDRMIIEQFPPKGRWGLVAPDRLPVKLIEDDWAQAKLPVGENIAANTPAGKTCKAQLQFKLTNLVEGDKVLVRLNGNELGEARFTDALSSQPKSVWVALDPDPKLVKEGYNIIGVKLDSQRDLAEMPMIDRLKLTVRYQ
jgi:hypothetical protein